MREKGSKRVMLKNVQEAKFRSILEPIAARVLSKAAQGDLSFESFFTHILAHEMTHGIGPHIRCGRVVAAQGIEGAVQRDRRSQGGHLTGCSCCSTCSTTSCCPRGADAERKLYTTFLASSFRTLRFGVNEAHGKGMALQFNYLKDKGAFRAEPAGSSRWISRR